MNLRRQSSLGLKSPAEAESEEPGEMAEKECFFLK